MNRLKSRGYKSFLALSLFLAAAPSAFAASTSCGVGLAPPSPLCKTSSIPAHRTNHFVHIGVSPFMKYRVVDSTNGNVVRRGTAGVFGERKTITGLYGQYYAAIDFSPQVLVTGGSINIRND